MSITSAKRDEVSVNFTDKPVETPYIEFLAVTGKLYKDAFTLSPVGYISIDHDWERYGKLESFADSGKKLFYLKTFKAGRVGEICPNPFSPFAQESDLSTFNTSRGVRMAEYRVVSERVFETYRTFLKTREDCYHKQVERDILNGDHLV